ncbi:MAG: transcriptional repressor [Armatimonadetes bacterium]|nr:transcriptional repressor [Armatimonadota bacterium]
MQQHSELEEAVRGTRRSLTRQRRAILSALRSTTAHPTAMEIFDMVRGELPHITLATVYRNLSVLQELGLVLEVGTQGSATRYDARTESHLHIVCVDCGRVDDVAVADLADIDEPVARNTGYKVLGHSTTYQGICPTCQREHANQKEP